MPVGTCVQLTSFTLVDMSVTTVGPGVQVTSFTLVDMSVTTVGPGVQVTSFTLVEMSVGTGVQLKLLTLVSGYVSRYWCSAYIFFTGEWICQ